METKSNRVKTLDTIVTVLWVKSRKIKLQVCLISYKQLYPKLNIVFPRLHPRSHLRIVLNRLLNNINVCLGVLFCLLYSTSWFVLKFDCRKITFTPPDQRMNLVCTYSSRKRTNKHRYKRKTYLLCYQLCNMHDWMVRNTFEIGFEYLDSDNYFNIEVIRILTFEKLRQFKF